MTLACCLGICVDLVTAHVAVEYFSVHHPKIIASQQPLALALAWGVAASWWFGAIAGSIAALINSRRPRPLPAGQILWWVAYSCIVIWLMMMLIVVAIMIISSFIPAESRRPSFESDRRLMAVALAHQYEYVMGAVACFVIAVRIWRKKDKAGSTEV